MHLQKDKLLPMEMSFHHFCWAERETLCDYMVLLKLRASESCLDFHMSTYDISCSHFALDSTVDHLLSKLAFYLFAAKLDGIWLYLPVGWSHSFFFQQVSNPPFILSSWFLFQFCFYSIFSVLIFGCPYLQYYKVTTPSPSAFFARFLASRFFFFFKISKAII